MKPLEASNTSVNDQFTKLQEVYISDLQGQIEYLKSELDMKNRLITDHARMIENGQVLLRDNQQKLLLLEEQIKEPPAEKPKGFLRKLFSSR